MYLTPQELVEARELNPIAPLYNPSPDIYGPNSHDAKGNRYGPIPSGKITLDTARQINRNALAAALRNRQMKVNRPWEIVDITKKLDPTQPWVGFEFETGFPNLQTHNLAVNYLWNYTRYVAIDREGPGNCPMEITFPPQELSKYEARKTYIQNFLAWAKRTKLGNSQHSSRTGTHANVSTPSFRKLKSPAAYIVVSGLNSDLGSLTQGERNEFFGRQPYGLGYYRNTKTTQWVEFKVFLSTYDLAKFDGYLKTTFRIAHLMELRSKYNKVSYSSIAAVLRGDEEPVCRDPR